MTIRSGTIEEGFLQDIVDHPDDPTTRLIYADWLEERDDPRSELIRLQHMEGEKSPQLRARERVLHLQEANRWRAFFASVGIPIRFLNLKGGLPYKINIDAPEFLKHAERLFCMAPIRAVQINLEGQDALQQVLRVPEMELLSELDMSCQELEDRGAYRIAAAHRLSNLRTLSVSSAGIRSDGVGQIVRSPHFSALENFDASLNLLGSDVMERIVQSERTFRSLRLSCTRLWPSALETLQQSDMMKGLERLDLSGNNFYGDSVASFAESRSIRHLRSLSFAWNDIGDGGARALSTCEHLGTLQRLNLSSCNITSDGADALISSPVLSSLKQLILNSNDIDFFGSTRLTLIEQAKKRGLELELDSTPLDE